MLNKKLLIIKTSSLGDIVQAFPVLSYLREKFPQAQIDWVAEKKCSELLLTHPQLNNIFLIDTKLWRSSLFSPKTWNEVKEFRRQLKAVEYDYIFDLQGNMKSSWILMQTKGKIKTGFGWKALPEWPNWFFTNKKITPPKGKNIREDHLALAQATFVPSHFLYPLSVEDAKMINALIPTNATLVAPCANWKNKRLPTTHLIKFLKQLDHFPYLFIWGNETEKQICEQIVENLKESTILPKLSLPQLQNCMARARLLVAMDSLPLHLAGTTQTPTISFFGPSLAAKYKPIGLQHKSYQGACPYNISFEKRCPKLRTCSTGLCMTDAVTQKNQN